MFFFLPFQDLTTLYFLNIKEKLVELITFPQYCKNFIVAISIHSIINIDHSLMYAIFNRMINEYVDIEL